MRDESRSATVKSLKWQQGTLNQLCMFFLLFALVLKNLSPFEQSPRNRRGATSNSNLVYHQMTSARQSLPLTSPDHRSRGSWNLTKYLHARKALYFDLTGSGIRLYESLPFQCPVASSIPAPQIGLNNHAEMESASTIGPWPRLTAKLDLLAMYTTAT